jgi:uncharacterized membrane protein
VATELLVLRLVHILGGIWWVGAGLFTTFFIAPALKAAGPAAAGAVMGNMQKRHLFTVMPIVAILTMLSGLRLMMIVSGGNGDWFRHMPGHIYSVSGALSIVAFLTSLLVARPAMVKAQKLAQGGGDSATIQKLQQRGATVTMIAVVLLVLAAAGMAVARYL